MHLSLAVLFTIAGLGFASADPSSVSFHHVLHEQRDAAHLARKFPPTRRLAHTSTTTIPLRIALTQQNISSLSEHLLAVSDPTSPTYGQHWSPEQVASTFAPAEESEDAVREWLAEAGITEGRVSVTKNRNRGWVVVNLTVGEAEELLKTEYFVFGDEQEHIGCHNYSIPAHLLPHIDLIQPTVHGHAKLASIQSRAPSIGKRSNGPRPALRHSAAIELSPDSIAHAATPNALANCSTMFTPACYRALYNLHYTPTETKRNSLGIVELTPQTYIPSDLDMFFANFSPSLVGSRPVPVFIDGGVFQNESLDFPFVVESSFDLSYAMSLTIPQPVQVLQTGDVIVGAGFDNWLDAVDGTFCTFEGGDDPTQDGIYPDHAPGGYNAQDCGTITAPYVVSISYGVDEAKITEKSAVRQCNEYGKLGLLGTSVFYPTGDNGVAGDDGLCMNSTGETDPDGQIFMPLFPARPASCPFVTAVGGTQLAEDKTVLDPQAETTWVGTGGGFSNYFAMPSYQASVVTAFLKNHPPPYTNGEFNNTGNARAFPDLSANADAVIVGALTTFFSTSASSPTTAAIFAMINDARLAKGKGPVGFINPAIYSPKFKKAFNDITTGNNANCGITTGWDPVTGLGSPDFEKLVKLFLALP
ncbi:subtilisin-like protein [Mycena amicta]|nr:subtilisin-like protein [Mycena amicta]